MTKEKFVRGKPKRNIGEIGSKNISHTDYARAISTFEYFKEESNKREKAKLVKLIEQYGLDKGYELYHKLKSQELEMFSECIPEANKENGRKGR